MIEEKFIDLYGVQVSTNSEAYKDACEARVLLWHPLEKRRSLIESFIKKRGRGEPATEYLIREGLQTALTKEWNWRRANAVEVPT